MLSLSLRTDETMNLALLMTIDAKLLLLLFNVFKGFKDGLALED